MIRTRKTRNGSAKVVYDGECPVCMSFREWTQKRDSADRLEFVPSRDARLSEIAPRVDAAAAARSLAVAKPDGTVIYGARAVAAVLRDLPQPWRTLGLVMSAPPFSLAARPVYRLIANNRRRLAGRR